MHISEGVCSGPVLITGAIITLTGTYIGLREIKEKDFPKVSIVSSGFFVASLIHVPLGPSSVHLVLNGLSGIILGWKSFPAILMALFLQALIFQFGGITVLGVNTANMAIPAMFSYYLFKNLIKKYPFLSGFLSGFFSIFFSCIFVSLSLYFTGEFFLNVGKTIAIAHIPVSLIEGIITGFVISFLKKVNPEIIGG